MDLDGDNDGDDDGDGGTGGAEVAADDVGHVSQFGDRRLGRFVKDRFVPAASMNGSPWPMAVMPFKIRGRRPSNPPLAALNPPLAAFEPYN